MTSENKKRLREVVEHGGWIIIWAGANMPCAYLDEPVALIYEDMDGCPAVCNAVYTYGDGGRRMNAVPFFKRVPDGAHMMNCIAWKYRPKEDI